MKIIKYIKIIPLALFLLLAGVSCDNGFDELAQNPNAPNDVPASFVLAGAQVDLSYQTSYQMGINYIGLWVQHHGSGEYPDEDQYSPRLNDINVYWNNIYDNALRDFKHILDVSESEGNVNQQAVAMIMSSYAYMSLADVWGDIPYTEALKGDDGISTPVFDTQQTVYEGIIADLNTATGLINASRTDGFGSEDVMYGGDMDKWLRFGNSLRLRAFMHLSKVDPTTAEAGVVAMLSQPLISSQAENAAIQYSTTSGNKNPVHSRLVGRENDFRISASVATRMIGNGTSAAPQDPRLPVYAELNDANEYVGIPNGVASLAAIGLTNASSSKIGALYAADNAPAYFMTYAEVQFIRAEAAARGWIADDPATAYENAISASMEQNGVTDAAAITTFLASTGVAYNAGTALEQIATQKWIALYGQSIEAWTEWRRTGFPDIPVALNDQNGGVIPRRLMYGSVEATTNAANVTVASERQGGAELSNRVWWDN
ncbi:MAG: SusD/RagB family nutrient-binding outer membrane lipoprotein [Reichenbachiella sp.]|uniref:SusD/RagB family nutrient-binding outer membrane lipoprotein n=1 Tax=Reichenbachiella sp. TaxID=2184521 RepID=UPI003263865D